MLRGSCLCGRVVYEISGEPMTMYFCHCETCRKANGSAFAANAMFRSEDFAIVDGRDVLSSFESSPNKRRWFCSRCGSPIYSQAEVTKGAVSVRCGTLDGDPGARPAMHVWADSKAPWFEIEGDLPRVGRGPG